MDRTFAGLSRPQVLVVAIGEVFLIGYLDYLTAYEISVSVFYMAPVAMVAWYINWKACVGISLLSCISFFIADAVAGGPSFNPLIEAWNLLVRFSFFMISGGLAEALRKSLFKQRELARTDSLTELLTRRAFSEQLEHDLALAQRNQSPITVAYVDIDNFKTVNDTFGHDEGDRVLLNVAQALRGATRSGDIVARLGGDEFALALPETDQRGAKEVIARLKQGLQKMSESSPSPVTCSMGFVTFQIAPASRKKRSGLRTR